MNPRIARINYMCKPCLWLSCILMVCVAVSSSAQSKPVINPADTVVTPVYKMYMSSIGGASNLYNGTEYTAVYPGTNGSPFWNNLAFQSGTISYDGVVYKDIPIAYDLVSGEVVIKGYRQLAIKLDASKINFFVLAGHLFVRVTDDEQSKNRLPEDLYDLVYNGKTKVYVKRKKQVERSLNAEDPYRMVSYNAYFIYKDGAYQQVMGKNALLKVFREKDDAIKSFWKQGNLNFKSGLEEAIIQTANYYDNH